MTIKITGNDAAFNADENGLVTARCKNGHLVRARERVKGEIIAMYDVYDTYVIIGGFRFDPPGIKCQECGEFLSKIEIINDEPEGK